MCRVLALAHCSFSGAVPLGMSRMAQMMVRDKTKQAKRLPGVEFMFVPSKESRKEFSTNMFFLSLPKHEESHEFVRGAHRSFLGNGSRPIISQHL